ncbi:MAG: multicopper oxidase domain-containing protein [Phycisphaerae bacterium]|nr:multicopper oxidase domain-containing protein [Phycisphaerae bacterium]NIX32026.1 multicopper oxidase domain-containing protein [Phycisphaerae bacterium]
MKKFTVLVVVLAAMALLLAACGGGDEESGPVALSFEGSDTFQFIPASASVSAGDEVEVTFTNTGALEHSWVLVAGDADAATVTDADAINNATTGTVAGGETGTVTFTAPDAGTYQFVCTIPGHAAAGMVGTLTVN